MTEIDDPFRRPETTVIRPRPGAGRRGGEQGRPPAASAPVPADAPFSAQRAHGLTPLVHAASPLLLLAGRLRGSVSPVDVDGLRERVLDEVQQFETRARAAGAHDDVVLTARYVICAALDEAVLSTPWGSQSSWAQQPLLVTLHRETWGGEKFFDILERVSGAGEKFRDLVELQYVCLAFGFAGKYHVKGDGDAQLAEVLRGVARRLREHRHAATADLSLRWRGLEDRRNPVVRGVPVWVVAGIALTAATLTFVYYANALSALAEPIRAQLSRIGGGS